MHSCNFAKDVSVQTSNIEHITLSNNNFNQLFNFNQCSDEIDLETELVMISIGGTNRGNVVIERAYFDINIMGVNFGDIFLKNSIIYTFYLTELENKGSITLTNIKSGSFFTIQDSTVGNLNFTNTDINNFNEIVITNSNIEKVNFKKYPKKVLSYSTDPQVGYGIKEKSKRTANLKDIYNQLKQIAKRTGEVDISNKYQSLEHKQLLLSKRFGFDSILLSLNLISNNNGRSWFIGVLFTVFIAFLFFLLYLKILDISFSYTESFKDYVLFISSFPKLQLEKYSELNSKWSVSLVIWLSRIFISYGIYQTIAAFRKYGKA